MILFILKIIFYIIVIILTLYATDKYIGESYIYLLFSFFSNLLLYFGFRKNAIFFDTFISVFLWLGFWLKTTVRIIYLNHEFSEGMRGLAITSNTFDNALLVSGLAFMSLLLASAIRESVFSGYSKEDKFEVNSLFVFYKVNRTAVLIFYSIIVLFIGITNYYLGIYQRGEITQTVLPFGLNGIYKWLLLFGLSSFSALILTFEFKVQKKVTYFIPILVLFESFITNVSLLSRGMILNSSALGLGVIHKIGSENIQKNVKVLIILIISFIVLFLTSVVTVNNIRNSTSTNIKINKSIQGVKVLFLDRWVGIEGMLAVSNAENRGWPLFNEALNEKYDEHQTSFYDLNLIESPYKNTDMSKHHYMSLPGFIAFFYYTDSILFLMLVLMILSFLASFIEVMSYKLSGGSVILAALFGQVIAYRYTHFGYVPMQSYLLFGALILNILIIYGLNKLFKYYYRNVD